MSPLPDTIPFYRDNAQRYFAATVDLDMAAVREPFQRLLLPGSKVLDAGCGSGRDMKAFGDLGFQVAGFDACHELVALAQDFTGLPVRCQTFAELTEVEAYDGVWACSSLVHLADVPREQALMILARVLRPGGVLYFSVKLGTEPFTDEDGRFFNPITEALAQELCTRVGLRVLSTGVTMSQRRPDQKWLDVIARRDAFGH